MYHRNGLWFLETRCISGFMLQNIFLVASGGALGSVLRYMLTRLLNTGFPYGTMAVNILGSFLMGLCAAYFFKNISHPLATFLMVGVLGGFTTFSSYSLDAVKLLGEGHVETALLYIIGSAALSIIALVIGLKLGTVIILSE